MKFRLLMIVVLVSVLGFQYLRVTDLRHHFTLNQTYTFEESEKQEGRLSIKTPQKYLVIYGEGKEASEKVLNNLERAFEFTKVRYDLMDILEEGRPLEGYTSIILAVEEFYGMKRSLFQRIEGFVRKGGNLIILQRSDKSPFTSMAGIAGIGGYIDTKGIKFHKRFFPGMDSTHPSIRIIMGSSLKVHLKPETEIIAVSDNTTPLLWETPFGRGRVLYANTTLFQGKISRGMMLQLIAYGNDYFIMPVFNSKAVHIDDFPAPIPAGSHKLIYDDYRLKTKNFFKTVWWPDMEGIARRQNLKYTGFMIGEYNDITDMKKMREFPNIYKEDLGYFGRELFQWNGEIGVHGYNHFSLAQEDGINFEDYNYTPWPEKKDMIFALKKLKGLIDDIYGERVTIYSYAAPSNLLTKEGKKAVIEAFPDLKVFSGVWDGEDEPGLLLQEPGRDPDYPEVYALPRFSSGFHMDEDLMWGIYNALALYGSVSHFVHPDDIIDSHRGRGKSWEELKESYEKMFAEVNKNFPLLEPETQVGTVLRYEEVADLEMSHEMDRGIIKINFKGFKHGVNAYVRIRERKIKDVDGGRYHLMDSTDKYNLYLVTFDQAESIILLGGDQ